MSGLLPAVQINQAKEFAADTESKFGKGEEYCVELVRCVPDFDVGRYTGRLKVRMEWSPMLGFGWSLPPSIDRCARVHRPLVIGVQCLKFKSTYPEDIQYLVTNVSIVLNSCHEVLDNKNLREFLVEIILSFGLCPLGVALWVVSCA